MSEQTIIADARAWRTGCAPTRDEVLTEIGRELAKRRELYPRHVEAGQMTQQHADERIDRLQRGYDYLMEHWPREQQGRAA